MTLGTEKAAVLFATTFVLNIQELLLLCCWLQKWKFIGQMNGDFVNSVAARLPSAAVTFRFGRIDVTATK
jgi:hypothetical protein